MGAWNSIYERFVVDRTFEVHRSRLVNGTHREVTEANKDKLRRSMLALSQNPALPKTDKQNLLTGYATKETAIVIPQSWINFGKLFFSFSLTIKC